MHGSGAYGISHQDCTFYNFQWQNHCHYLYNWPVWGYNLYKWILKLWLLLLLLVTTYLIVYVKHSFLNFLINFFCRVNERLKRQTQSNNTVYAVYAQATKHNANQQPTKSHVGSLYINQGLISTLVRKQTTAIHLLIICCSNPKRCFLEYQK